jgi:malonate-semialdehyde dehydrogenase (acetylating)/methylmalonate-semialdehyde dehydrogenase
MNTFLEAMRPLPLVQHFIGGALTSGCSARQQAIYNPATGSAIREVVLAAPQDLQAAVEATRTSQPAWADTPPQGRARVLFEFLRLLNAERDAVAAVITEEHGKVLADARGEVMRGIEIVEFACGIASAYRSGIRSAH